MTAELSPGPLGRTRGGGVWRLADRAATLLILTFCIADAARAAEAEWSLLLEPMYMEAYGHDQHVLTIHELDLDSTPATDAATPVTLDTESNAAFRFELQYTRGTWGAGLDFLWFNTSQGRPSRSAAAGGAAGPIDQVDFEIAGRSFTSNDPSEVLFFDVLEDTDIATWSVDLYGIKTLAESAQNSLQLQFGLRNADFDNDFHSAVGIQDAGGTLTDASSNYGRMTGPLLGLSGEVQLGKSTIRGYLGQSLIFGTAELSAMRRDFTGPVSDPPAVVATESFGKDQDVAIPITEFRINWLYPLSRRIAVGVAANTTVWWDVPVPPGVIPIAAGGNVFHENTIVYFGLGVAVKLRM